MITFLMLSFWDQERHSDRLFVGQSVRNLLAASAQCKQKTNGRTWRGPIKKQRQKTTPLATHEFHVAMQTEYIYLDQYDTNLKDTWTRASLS